MKIDYSKVCCDVHPESILTSKIATSRTNGGAVEVKVLSCEHDGCHRYYHRSVGYQEEGAETLAIGALLHKCAIHDRFMLVISTPSGYVYACPEEECDVTEARA